MPSKRPNRSTKPKPKSKSKPKPKAPPPTTEDICSGPCAFTEPKAANRKIGEVTVTIKTTTVQFNAIDILNGSKDSLSSILAAGGGAVAAALSGVVSQWMAKKP